MMFVGQHPYVSQRVLMAPLWYRRNVMNQIRQEHLSLGNPPSLLPISSVVPVGENMTLSQRTNLPPLVPISEKAVQLPPSPSLANTIIVPGLHQNPVANLRIKVEEQLTSLENWAKRLFERRDFGIDLTAKRYVLMNLSDMTLKQTKVGSDNKTLMDVITHDNVHDWQRLALIVLAEAPDDFDASKLDDRTELKSAIHPADVKFVITKISDDRFVVFRHSKSKTGTAIISKAMAGSPVTKQDGHLVIIPLEKIFESVKK